jgi:hypothetical protein
MHPFFAVIVATFAVLVGVLLAGIMSIGNTTEGAKKRGNKLMFLRVAIGIILLLEILFYALMLKP